LDSFLGDNQPGFGAQPPRQPEELSANQTEQDPRRYLNRALGQGLEQGFEPGLGHGQFTLALDAIRKAISDGTVNVTFTINCS
jgi:hypothetical protein